MQDCRDMDALSLSEIKGEHMLNKEGFERDLAILKEWKDSMTSEEYQNSLEDLYFDYGLKENNDARL